MRKTIYFVLITVLAAASALDLTGQTKTSGNRFVDAVTYYVSGNIDAAKKDLQLITRSEPQNDAAWYYLGLCHLAEKNRDEARICMDKAAQLDSTNYWYRDAQLTTIDPSEDLELTIARYERLLRDFPKNTDRQYVLLNLYMAAGKTDKALEVVNEIEGRDGKSDASVMTRSNILRKTDKIDESYQVMRDYVAEYSSPYVLSVLGEYEMSIYNDKEALEYFNEALSLNDSYFPAKLGRAETFRLTREYKKYFDALKEIVSDPEEGAANKSDYLVQVFRSTDSRFLNTFKPQLDSVMTLAVDSHPKDSVMLQTASSYYAFTGSMDKGLEHAKLCRDLYPQSRPAAYSYIQMLSMGEDWKAVSEACQDAIVKFPKEDVFIELDNHARYNLKDYKGVLENAKTLLSKAAGDSAKTLSALSQMGDMYHMLGENKNAYKTYDKALKINPSYAPVLNNYAWYLCQEGKQLKKALKMSRRTIELEPKNATYLDTYGWILHLTGNSLEAKLFFKQAMLYGGKESATIMIHYIVVLEAVGEKELADVYRSQLKNLPKDDE
ncbi:MAG: tetratricopeptide repeat protein [Bacteroidales bacterium]|nr:tetratricopeptide repeat protein [Bacteroidales bacterium]